MPLIRTALKGVSTPPKKGQIDRAYKKQVSNNYRTLFHPNIERKGSDIFEFDLKYLEALKSHNEWYNDNVLAFWNIHAPKLFKKASENDALRKDAESRKRYANALEKLLKEVEDKYDNDVRPKKDELSKISTDSIPSDIS
ncbi:MAG: hypothetical protein GQ559_12210 [Desulfobulbaceae bacterium]|nr:hypothetical protein [Desulfobulbaceae bacterium]